MQNDLIILTINALKSSRETLIAKLVDFDKAIAFQESLLNGENHINPPPIIRDRRISPNSSIIQNVLAEIFEEHKKPLKLKELQDYYTDKTGSDIDIRDNLRSMQKRKDALILKVNNSNRNSYWVKGEWVKDNELQEDFDSLELNKLYSKNQITFS